MTMQLYKNRHRRHSEGTPRDAYAVNKREAIEMLEELLQRVKTNSIHPKPLEQIVKADWGHVGDLKHVHYEVTKIMNFINNAE